MLQRTKGSGEQANARRGRPLIGKKPVKADLIRLYTGENKSIREVAEELRCSKDMVGRALKSYGIEARTNASRSRLRMIELSVLEEAVRVKGIRGYARELGITEGALRHHLKVRKRPK